MRKFLSEWSKRLLPFYIIAVFFAFWEIAPRVGLANPHFIPPFSAIVLDAVNMTLPRIFVEISVSLKRILIGFSLASLVALPTGFLLGGAFPKVSQFLKPLLSFLSQIPAFILFPIFVVIFGIGERGIYTVILWAAFWPVLFTTITGVQQVDPILVKSARGMGASQIVIFFKVILPGALSSIMTGMRTGMTMSFMMLIGAESLGADSGMGWLIHNSQSMARIPRIYLAAILVAVVGLAINYLLQWLEDTIIIWKDASQDTIF